MASAKNIFCFRKPDLEVDPENIKVRETKSSDNEAFSVDNRFGESASSIAQKKCGVQLFMERIIGGEICQLDEFPWFALLLYESSKGAVHRIIGIFF